MFTWALVNHRQPAPVCRCDLSTADWHAGGKLPNEVAHLPDKMNHPVLGMKFISSPKQRSIIGPRKVSLLHLGIVHEAPYPYKRN